MTQLLKNGVSLVICCYNGAKRIQKVLYHLSKQTGMQGIAWEIILIDNNSTDDTTTVVETEWKKLQSNIPLKIVHEDKPGLSFARQKGVHEAIYNIVIFCDDDNWLQNNYVSLAYQVMLENEQVGIVGGMGLPFAEIKLPSWFDSYQNVYAVGKQLPATGYANKRGYLMGAGMIIRKQIFLQLESIGFISMLSDRKGNELSSGGDTELCLLAMQSGYDLYYDERLQFTHYITSNRLKWSYCVAILARGFAYPQIYFAMYDYCFNAINKGEKISFEDLYRWNRRKQERILMNEFNGVQKFFDAILALMRSKPGNDKEIKIKTAINKLRHMKKNKHKLAKDFETILAYAKRIKQFKTTPFVLHK